jgi:hypothetical protein
MLQLWLGQDIPRDNKDFRDNKHSRDNKHFCDNKQKFWTACIILNILALVNKFKRNTLQLLALLLKKEEEKAFMRGLSWSPWLCFNQLRSE